MGNKHRGEQADHQTDNEGDCETFDLLGPDKVENNRRDQCGQIGVENGGPRSVESVANRHTSGCLFLGFFSNAFEYKHVRVNAHTDGQNQSGDAGESERLLDKDDTGQDHA